MDVLIGYVQSGEPDLSNVSKPVVTRALNTLSALGYLRRERDESDRRNIFIARTLNGARFLERFEKLIGQRRPSEIIKQSAELERANTG